MYPVPDWRNVKQIKKFTLSDQKKGCWFSIITILEPFLLVNIYSSDKHVFFRNMKILRQKKKDVPPVRYSTGN